MRKAASKKRSMKRKGRRAGKPVVHARKRAKRLTSAQKARAAHKLTKAKLAALKIDFKEKFQKAVDAAYAKARNTAVRLLEGKATAKQKVLATAAAKFEKKFNNKLAKAERKAERKAAKKLARQQRRASKGRRPAAAKRRAPARSRRRSRSRSRRK
jgi:hypothetical protein